MLIYEAYGTTQKVLSADSLQNFNQVQFQIVKPKEKISFTDNISALFKKVIKMSCSACNSVDFEKKIYDHHHIHITTEEEGFEFINKNVPQQYIFKGLVEVCSKCGHGELATRLSPSKIAEYYDRAFWGKSNLNQRVNDAVLGKFSSTHTARAKRQREFINSFLDISAISSVLEIGAGDALLTRELQSHTPSKVKFDVCEPGEHWLPYYNKYNIEKAANFFPFESEKKYDLIVNSHWLEHVQDVNKTFLQLSQILKPKGHLMIEVPNTAHNYWRLRVRDTPHIHFFTVQSLNTFATKAGFEVIEIGEFGISFEEYCDGKKPDYDELGKNEKGYSVVALLRKV
ncbi:methyltransferase domain-containing protein [Alteromonas gracilis]|uniref:methyltransferase domain-containing protein n=1 Tax=Alteromonas gracilis TaxID=1479524 RepID=UPI003735D4F8